MVLFLFIQKKKRRNLTHTESTWKRKCYEKKRVEKVDYIATTDERDKDGGKNENGPKHNEVMLKAKNNPFSCNTTQKKERRILLPQQQMGVNC